MSQSVIMNNLYGTVIKQTDDFTLVSVSPNYCLLIGRIKATTDLPIWRGIFDFTDVGIYRPAIDTTTNFIDLYGHTLQLHENGMVQTAEAIESGDVIQVTIGYKHR